MDWKEVSKVNAVRAYPWWLWAPRDVSPVIAVDAETRVTAREAPTNRGTIIVRIEVEDAKD